VCKVRVTIQRMDKIIDDTFGDRKVLKALYMRISNMLMNTIEGGLKKYIIFKAPDLIIAEETAALQYCEKRKREIIEFLLSDESNLKNYDSYKRVANDRNVKGKIRYFCNVMAEKMKVSKSYLVKKAIIDKTVLSLLNQYGVTMSVEVIK